MEPWSKLIHNRILMSVLGVYGGSFDPPHVAHVMAGVYALSVGRFDRLLVVPVFQHAFAKELAPFEHRVRMCELAFQGLSRVAVSRIEAELPVPSRTLQTVRALCEKHQGEELRLVVGTDVLAEAHKWHAFDAIERQAPLFVVGRMGEEPTEVAALPAISSTRVRSLLAGPQHPEWLEELRRLVPGDVLDYAIAHRLYG